MKCSSENQFHTNKNPEVDLYYSGYVKEQSSHSATRNRFRHSAFRIPYSAIRITSVANTSNMYKQYEEDVRNTSRRIFVAVCDVQG